MHHRFGRFELRPAQRTLLADGQPAALGARAFDVLLALVERRERVVGAGELFDLVWPGVVVEENNLRQQVAALRKVLGPHAIATVAGRGYRFVLPLEEAPAAQPRTDNLPAHLPALIGREAELASVLDLAAGAPLLTLLGTGGVGKTRLALALAARRKEQFRDGTWLVELAPVADPALLTRVVASALDVHEEPQRPLLDTLLDFLRNAQLQIVLDNCEHLVEACARWVERMLQGSPGVRVLATSREPLGIACEQVWRVLTLRAPAVGEEPDGEQLMAYAAAQLFVERATAADPAFRITPGNAGAVARICRQLDGIPLAIELAAARVKAMRVEQIADRLHDRFALLTRGSRTALERHQTLRSLVDWSHDLLSEPERMLLRRLSVFAGGWTLEAAEATCPGDGLAAGDVLELHARLVEKSLVMLDEEASEPRYRALETIRQYGLEKLRAAGEEAALRTAHLHWLAAFAEEISPRIGCEDPLPWQARAQAELDNIRVALDWALEAGHTEPGLRLVNALHRYWYRDMNWGEVVDWQRRLAERFERQGLPPDVHYARSFHVAGMLATNFDPQAGRDLCQRGLAISREIGFGEGAAWALMWTGHIDQRRRDPATEELFAESFRLGERVEDPWRRATLLGNALVCYANYLAAMGRDGDAEATLRECEAQIARAGNDAIYIGHCRALQATMAARRGELNRAEALVAESLALRRSVDSKFDVASSLAQQGLLALRQREPERALRLFRESLPLYRSYPQSHWVTRSLAQLVIAYAACDRPLVAAQLAGALAGAEGPIDTAPPEVSAGIARAYEEAVARVRAALGDAAFDAQAVASRRMTREEAIALALAGAHTAH